MSKHRQNSKKKQQTQNIRPWGWIIAGVAIMIVALGIIFIRPGESPATADVAQAAMPAEVSVQNAHNRFQDGAYLLDVRTPAEWNDFHIEGATLIPLDELSSRMNEVPKDQDVVIVCRTGNRSAQARDMLRSAGFTQVTSMAGGVVDWRRAGYPTVSGP